MNKPYTAHLKSGGKVPSVFQVGQVVSLTISGDCQWDLVNLNLTHQMRLGHANRMHVLVQRQLFFQDNQANVVEKGDLVKVWMDVDPMHAMILTWRGLESINVANLDGDLFRSESSLCFPLLGVGDVKTMSRSQDVPRTNDDSTAIVTKAVIDLSFGNYRWYWII